MKHNRRIPFWFKTSKKTDAVNVFQIFHIVGQDGLHIQFTNLKLTLKEMFGGIEIY